MCNWSFRPLERDYAQKLIVSQPHHVQSSLRWFDFIKEYSNERDRSITIRRAGEPVGFMLALQHHELIQSLPYPASYAGPCLDPMLPQAERQELIEAMLEHFSWLGDVLSICTSPFFGKTDLDREFFDYECVNEVHYIDLALEPLAGTTSKFRNNLKRNLRKAEDAGVTIYESRSRNDLESWYHCYDKRMSEFGGAKLPLEYFQSMFEHLQSSGDCGLISANCKDKYVGGIITLQNEHCRDYYLSMFDRDYDECQASTAAFEFLLNSTRSSGIKILNLQSSPRSEVDLIKFKESWGAKIAQNSYLVRMMNNKDKLLQLTPEEIKKNYQFHFLLPFDALHAVPQPV